MADTYRVTLSVQDAAARIKDEVLGGSVTGELLDFHQVSHANPQCVVMVFEKYYMRVSNRLTLTVTVDDAPGYTRVHAVGGGGGEGALFRFDWGAAESFTSSVPRALSGYIV
ncbi:MAG: DUF6054 family protein [Bacillota bacterium]